MPATMHAHADQEINRLRERVATLEHHLAVVSSRQMLHEDILDSISDAVIVLDQRGVIQSWNRAATQTYGWSADEAHGQALMALVSTRYIGGLSDEQALQQLIAHGEWTGIVIQRHRDGRDLMIEASVRYLVDSHGQRTGLVGVNRDITERWRLDQERAAAQKREQIAQSVALEAQRSLSRSQAQFAGIVASTMDAIISVDAQQRIVLFNPAAEQIFQYRSEDIVGQSLQLLIPTRFHAAHSDHMREFARSHTGPHLMEHGQQTVGVRADGSEFPVEASVSYIAIDSDPYYIVTLRDITARRQLEAQLRQSQKMEALGRLAGGIAHDFNNLLTAMMGYTQFALDALDGQPAIRADLEEVLHATHRATSLTRQLLTFARKQLMETQTFDLNALLLEMEKLLRRVIGEDIELITQVAPEPALISADPGQIEQVILNLAINARDAMPDGGQLWIATRHAAGAAPGGALQAAEGAGSIVLTLRDTGTGMPPEVRARAFEPFFTTKELGKGTGLGLATSYGIVQQHGGAIEIESEPGQGTAIIIHLPRVSQLSARQGSAGGAAPNPGGAETILLVEDSDAVRSMAGRILRDHGYTVLEARDGDAALDLIRSQSDQIDMVVSDIVMPGYSGPILVEEIRTIRPGIRVLFISGYNSQSASIEGHAFLHKPFGPTALARKVRAVLDQPAAEG
jgi:two-component system, cell cycle sensor histidine kinase and response regulator CckA